MGTAFAYPFCPPLTLFRQKHLMSALRILTPGLFGLCLFVFAQPLLAQDANALNGYWYTEDDKSIVKVFLNKAGTYSAKIVWLRDSLYENGQPRLDDNNDDPELQKRPLEGLVFMKGFKYDAGDKKWEGGELYDPESGNTYKGYMEMESPTKVKLRGYVGVPMFGRTSYWRKHTGPRP